MDKKLIFAEELIDFIYRCPSAFHATSETQAILHAKGFKELKLNEAWEFGKNKKFYVKKNDSAIIAFTIGEASKEGGFRIIGAHTDSPGFKIKPSPELKENRYIKLNTEVYGGPILNTWLDRPLAIAGRVTLKSDNPLKPRSVMVNIQKPVLIIPNLAIHMNRNVNSGVELNKQKDTLPMGAIVSESLEKDNYLLNIVAEKLGEKKEDILDFDLFLYEYEKGILTGFNNELISSSRLDDLAMVHAGVTAICKAKPKSGINILACFDNEEVGSGTKQGAGSKLLYTVLERIALVCKMSREEFLVAIENSFMVSADMAHAIHPNSPEKNDPTNKPFINNGIVIKLSANQSYTTDSDSSAVFQMLCKKCDVPFQKFVNRSDERGGSTIGPISSSHLQIRCVDIGNPMLSMHSVRELAGVEDHWYVAKVFEEFYAL